MDKAFLTLTMTHGHQPQWGEVIESDMKSSFDRYHV